MKAEVKTFETSLQARGQQMNDLRKKMQPFAPGSPEYKKLEAEIMRVQADGQIAAAQKKKEFLEREAKIYFEVYNEVTAEVAKFAEQHGIGLVIRFNSEPIDPTNRQAVLEGVNRAVIFQKNLNITNAILQRLEQTQVSNRPAAAAPR
jgi:Skp family chaperone for outer membrane proteins